MKLTLEQIRDFLDFNIIKTGKLEIDLYNILFLVVLTFVTIWVVKLITKIFTRKAPGKKLEPSQAFVINKLINYFIIVIAVIIGLESLGVKLTILLASSAALFVGIGLGVQEVFKDIISGFILLFGGTIKIGDVIEFGDLIGEVKEIGFRVSRIMTRNDIVVIIPNNKLTQSNVINWSFGNRLTRFHLSVGVAYGSDVQKVRQILLECARVHPNVSKEIEPFVRFTDFGNSSLDFELLFWSTNIFRIENVLSDLRFEIDRKFREKQVTIPFPQRDVHIRTQVGT
ncbi:MAG: mechanosensitive ion channel [Bacteroidales bacterium]|nr:mechanosensitive ion channel [Bacteroidales bacterium]